ncbi:hypothetical protein [Streptomyces sp. NPDC057686]|uniref:DUF6197 family protein n=1 Tax=Streptomyces sp. NPDC057686 TaxID=3346212 RepID=UPI003697DD99
MEKNEELFFVAADDMTPKQILEDAIKVLERDGWHQGSLTAGNAEQGGAVCAWGAMGRAATGNAYCYNENVVEAADLLAHSLNLEGLPTSAIFTWNDAKERSKEDVILAMKKAAHGEV